jgi:aminopeptidase N
MKLGIEQKRIIRRAVPARPAAVLLVVLLAMAGARVASVFGDEPYARSKDYDLQHSKIALRFNVEKKQVTGDVTHTLTILRDGTAKIWFDSVGLDIHSVTVNKAAAKFETTAEKLIVALPGSAKAGEEFDVEIKYDGKPNKGLYFILPDKDYPDRPKEIWTQGESEDTRNYLPTYDEPNDRLTTETILTVPAAWTTIANGKLMSVVDSGSGMKTWTWKESVPSSTYLITVVAGEFDEVKESWHGLPLTYYAPKGRGDRLPINYGRTPLMIELFTKKFGVEYPWEKYAQVMVDDFVAGGMENSSATTNTSTSLVHPKLVAEYPMGQDDLISHELAHQWFGDLVTCKDWGDIWLNEGFATYAEMMWQEAHYGKDQADYERWKGARQWFGETNLFKKSIVRHDFADDSDEFDGNAYGKGGWVLYMLRHELGDEVFYGGLKHYLEANHGKNVVTADFGKAIEEATHRNIDEFLGQWIYGAGAPKFDLKYSYDETKHEVALTVKQIQKREGRVGLFQVPVEVEITTASGPKLYNITVSKEEKVYTFPAGQPPLMVLFDKGSQLLEASDFHKEKKEWIYQLKNASEVADRADAALSLGRFGGDEEAAAALGIAVRSDKAQGVRQVAAEALGELGGAPSQKELLEALKTQDKPWVRQAEVAALANFKGDAQVIAKLDEIAREDSSYRARAAALEALGGAKAASAFATLSAAVAADSPDGFLRKAALRSFAGLGDDRAVPLLKEWSAVGKPIDTRTAAIYSLARLKKDDKEITELIAGYMTEPRFPVRVASINALGWRGDKSAIPALEAMLKSDDLSIEVVPMIKRQIGRLRGGGGTKNGTHAGGTEETSTGGASQGVKPEVADRLERLEKLVHEMNERLKSIESKLSAK